MRFEMIEAARAVGGSFAVAPADEHACVTSLTWDSRAVQPGGLYVALPGERVDGHNFAAAAVKAGAVCVLAQHALDADALCAIKAAGAGVIEVADTAAAVTALARAWRSCLAGRVIGITGSTGKTTTKNLVRDVLSAAGSVVATKGNQNNELGVPNTVLAADAGTRNVIVEMGMRGLHQLDALCEFVRPEWGLVTNVGESHIELLGSRENIARAKAEMLFALPHGGMAFVNAANDMTPQLRAFAKLDEHGVACVLYDGTADAAKRRAALSAADAQLAAVWSEDVQLDAHGCPSFTLCAANFAGMPEPVRVPCTLALRGMHNVSNACSAAAVGIAAGMTPEQVAAALGTAQPETGRQEVLAAPAGFTVINDAYNANPDSMRASLSTFAALKVAGRRIAVLGDMGELGSFAPGLHTEVGTFAAACGLDYLVCVGTLAQNIAAAACAAGMNAENVVCVADGQAALAKVSAYVKPGDAVLVKASHFMGLEQVVEGLVK